MIYCCGGYHNPFQTVSLDSNYEFSERKLEISTCPNCGNLLVCLVQFNLKTKKFEVYRPKRKHVAKFLKTLESGKWKEVKQKYGTREKAAFIYGVNKECKNGNIYQYAVNFNGGKKLVKVLKKR